MREYYFTDAKGQQGPFSLKELKGKNIMASTPVWYHPLPKWTTAGEVAELKDILVQSSTVIETKEEIKPLTVVETPVAATQPVVVTPTVIETKEEVKPLPVVETPVVETAPVVVTPIVIETKEEVKPLPVVETPVAVAPVTTKVTTTTSPVATATPTTKTVAAKPARKKSTAWLSWVLSLLVLGGVGYYIYQDMEKNKTAGTGIAQTDSTTNSTDSVNSQTMTSTASADTSTSPTDMTGTISDTSTSTGNMADTATTITTTTVTPTDNTTTAAKQLQAKKKAEEEKKKKADAEKKKQAAAQAALANQKAEQERQKQIAAQAMLAKELQMRNNWPNYVTFGKLDYKVNDDGISAFNVPVYNATDAVLDKVTVRIDYLKKESKSKVYKTETIVLYNIPPKSGMNGKAPEYKKGKTVNAYIIGIISRKLHFCYPQNNGNPSDPYFCN